VKQEGCTEAQGYYVSPPRPAADIPDVLARFKVTPERAVRRAG
jgi:EAL domain-containing protein (putative c-di-GMP-specific phosphodiesterase class I)